MFQFKWLCNWFYLLFFCSFDLAKEAVKKGFEVLAKNTKIEKLYFPESDMVVEITVEENYQVKTNIVSDE